MKKLLTICTILIVLFVTVNPSRALRCGTNLVNVGDLKFEVLNRCGEPLSKELLGFKLTDGKRREFKIEQWVYGPWNGFYYVLLFEGGVLVEILPRKDF